MSAPYYRQQELCELLDVSARAFRRLYAAGALPFVEELRPRVGRFPRYRADLVDQYFAGQWGTRPRLLLKARA